MQAEIICVYNEGAKEDTPLIGAKGFSLLVRADDRTVLLDTGMRGRYLMHNLGHMHIKADEITDVVLTHNHRSNVNGLRSLIDARKEGIDVYSNEDYQGLKGSIINSLDPTSLEKMHLTRMDSPVKLSDHIGIIGPFGPLKEFALVLDTVNGPVVMTSCFHCGVEPVLSEVKERYGREAYGIIGGMHFHRANQKTVDPTVEVIKSHGIRDMYINHCATPNGITYLRVRFGLSGVNDFYVGDKVGYEV